MESPAFRRSKERNARHQQPGPLLMNRRRKTPCSEVGFTLTKGCISHLRVIGEGINREECILFLLSMSRVLGRDLHLFRQLPCSHCVAKMFDVDTWYRMHYAGYSAFEPLAGRRRVEGPQRRTNRDFAPIIRRLVDECLPASRMPCWCWITSQGTARQRCTRRLNCQRSGGWSRSWSGTIRPSTGS